tara:strand:- start:115 stop:390 length:276 start_codon:yes stop_codon:yes gene_type:complete
MNKEDLIKYCLDNNRICPMPHKWTEVGEIIKIRPGLPGYLTPLILGGWDSSDEEKRDRLKKQIEYASKDTEMFEKLKNFILSLKDDDWHYK